jgi:predicted thioesterase
VISKANIFLNKPIPIGAQAEAEAEETVEFKHALTAHHPELPPVYSTPDMIRLMETAAFHALHPYCEGDEISQRSVIGISAGGVLCLRITGSARSARS